MSHIMYIQHSTNPEHIHLWYIQNNKQEVTLSEFPEDHGKKKSSLILFSLFC